MCIYVIIENLYVSLIKILILQRKPDQNNVEKEEKGI